MEERWGINKINFYQAAAFLWATNDPLRAEECKPCVVYITHTKLTDLRSFSMWESCLLVPQGSLNSWHKSWPCVGLQTDFEKEPLVVFRMSASFPEHLPHGDQPFITCPWHSGLCILPCVMKHSEKYVFKSAWVPKSLHSPSSFGPTVCPN